MTDNNDDNESDRKFSKAWDDALGLTKTRAKRAATAIANAEADEEYEPPRRFSKAWDDTFGFPTAEDD